MFDKRDLQARARGALHAARSVPALYYPADRDANTEGAPCTVRVHHRAESFGDMTGFAQDAAERFSTVPEIVALGAEVSPARGGVFSLAADEAYRVEAVLPRDGLTSTSQATRMTQQKIAADVISYPEAPA